MNQKRILVYGLIFAALAALVYIQFRHWRTFDWARFVEHTRDVSWLHVIQGVALIYSSYFLRALRWKIFLRPIRKDVSILSLVSPQVVGFTGLALLGRPGELIRPYVIARRINLSFSSQMAVWTVERIFDLGAFTILLVSAVFLPTNLRAFAASSPLYDHWLRVAGYLLTALVAAMFLGAVLISYKGHAIADRLESSFSSGHFAHKVANRIREFAAGLNTIHGFSSFFILSGASLLMWWIIAIAYAQVTAAYGAPMREMSSSTVLLLMGSSMVGSLLQLPGVGGGSQLAAIEALDKVFRVPRELAVSCGILLWLVTFMSVVPVGLLLAHRERLSLRRLSAESQHEEEAASVLPSEVG